MSAVSIRTVVVLPAPLGPSRPRTSPRATRGPCRGSSTRSRNSAAESVAWSIASCTATRGVAAAARRVPWGPTTRRQHATLGRPLQRRERPEGRRLHPLHRGGCRPRRRRSRGLDRARPWPGARRAPERTRSGRAGRRTDRPGRGRGRRPDRLGPVPRGRPHEPRGRPRRTDRPGRGQAPHGPVPQRPGRHGPAALDAAGDRSPRCGQPRLRTRPRRARRTRARRGPAGYDPHPARPAGAVRPPPAGVRRDGRTRSSPPRGRPVAGPTSARSVRARSPEPATRSIARRRHGNWTSTGSRRTRSMPCRIATSSSRRSGRSRSGWSTSAGSPRS